MNCIHRLISGSQSLSTSFLSAALHHGWDKRIDSFAFNRTFCNLNLRKNISGTRNINCTEAAVLVHSYQHVSLVLITRLTWMSCRGGVQVGPDVALRYLEHPSFACWPTRTHSTVAAGAAAPGLKHIITNPAARCALTRCAWKCSWGISRPGLAAGGGTAEGSSGRTGWTPAGPGGPAGNRSTWTQQPDKTTEEMDNTWLQEW